jgi:MurNAc alpha-1-phosphate uridylyltransferase
MSVMPKQAMVLAAGLGKRMRPLTDHLPKPLIEVAGRTLIDRAIDRLEEAGITKIIVNSSYKAEMLEAHLQKRSPDILFSRETEPLETGGGIAQALHYFDNSPFFAANGDIIWLDNQINALQRLYEAWEDGLDALLLLHSVQNAIGYEGKGDFFINDTGYLKRRNQDEEAPYVYAGVQLLHPSLFKDAPSGAFSINILYNQAMLATPHRIKAIVHEGAWLHVGDVKGKDQAEDYLRARNL